MKFLSGYKTYLTALAALLTAIAACINQYTAGEPVNIELVITALIALTMIFLRKGISTETKKIQEIN